MLIILGILQIVLNLAHQPRQIHATLEQTPTGHRHNIPPILSHNIPTKILQLHQCPMNSLHQLITIFIIRRNSKYKFCVCVVLVFPNFDVDIVQKCCCCWLLVVVFHGFGSEVFGNRLLLLLYYYYWDGLVGVFCGLWYFWGCDVRGILFGY